MFEQGGLRFSLFIAIFAIMLLLECLYPRRKQGHSRPWHMANNVGLLIAAFLVVRILVPFSLVEVADFSSQQGLGLFNWLDLPYWLGFIVSLLLLDLAIYLQHRLLHIYPLLWRLHVVHHMDLDYDVTTGLRFHPLEILISIAFKIGLIVLIGVPVLAVLVFEILLNGMAMFNHSNFAIPLKVDRWLRYLVVTPDMHRVHHSVKPKEFNSNFGFNISLWDKLFGSYLAQPEEGHVNMSIGQRNFRDARILQLKQMLIQPFLKK